MTGFQQIAEELREFTALKYAGDCKCGKCQLVPRSVLDRTLAILSRLAASRPAPVAREAVSDLVFWYRNYKGEERYRHARPLSIRFDATEWHHTPQWLMRAIDLEKNEEREFAMKDMRHILPQDTILSLFRPAEPVEAKQRDTWNASKHDEIIKRLMEQVGMPNSRSLYQAFKQFANELHHMDLGASATASTTPNAVDEPVEAERKLTPEESDLLHQALLNSSELVSVCEPVEAEGVGEPVAWRVMVTHKSGLVSKTYNEYTERLPFEPLEGSGVVVRREPEPLYTHPPKSPDTSAALKHLGQVLYILAELHEDDQCQAFVDALAFYNASGLPRVAPVVGYSTRLVQTGPLAEALGIDTSAAVLAERERCAAVCERIANEIMERAEAAHEEEDYDGYERLECAALEYSHAAAAIRQLPTTERGE